MKSISLTNGNWVATLGMAGLTVAWLGYPATFALAAAFPVAALAMVPVRDERALS